MGVYQGCRPKGLSTQLVRPTTNESHQKCDILAVAILVVCEHASTSIPLAALLYGYLIKPAPYKINGCDWPRLQPGLLEIGLTREVGQTLMPDHIVACRSVRFPGNGLKGWGGPISFRSCGVLQETINLETRYISTWTAEPVRHPGRVSFDVHRLVLRKESLGFQEAVISGQAEHRVLLRRTVNPVSPYLDDVITCTQECTE